MKKKYVYFLSAAASLALFVSCGSTPKAPETTVEEVVEEVIEQEIPETDVDNSGALSKTEAARQAAVDAGAENAAAEQFAAVDALYQAAKIASESGKDMSKELGDIESRFAALEQYASAKAAKQKIEENDFISYDKTAYDNGCSALAEADGLLVNPLASSGSQLEAAKTANGSFKAVLFKAYRSLAKDERGAAFSAKKDADGVKAGAAAKTAYTAAVDEFKAGDSSYAMQNPEAALAHYTAAKTQFEAVFADVSAKRAAAQKAMDEAKAKVNESQSYAQAADEKAPLSGDVQGIEAADAVLLEHDEYENPQDFEVSVPESVDDGEDSAETEEE